MIKLKNIILEILTKRRFIVDKKNLIFQLFLGNTLVAQTDYAIEKPDELFNQKYVSLFMLKTIKFIEKEEAKHLLEQIFDYVKNKLKINNILLNVYKSNYFAVNLYLRTGFEVYQNHEHEDEEEPYFTLIKKL